MEDHNVQVYELLKDFYRSNEDTGNRIIEEIRELLEDKAAPSLIYILQNDEDYNNRVNAALILGELGDRQAIEPLIKAFKDNPVWPNAVYALSKFNDPSLIEPMIMSMDTPAKRMSHGAALDGVIRKILSFGEPAFQALLNHLNDPALREQVAQALGTSKDRRGVEPLIKILNDPKAGPVAANALAEIGDLRAIKPLTEVLQSGATDKQRQAAAEALGDLKDPGGFQTLEQVMNDPSQSDTVRSAAANALGQGGSNSIPALLNALTNNITQSGAASGLAAAGQTEPLIAALSDPNNQVRTGAAIALGMVGNIMSNSPLGATQAPIEPLIEALKDKDVTVRESAIQAILNIVMHLSITSMMFSSSGGTVSGMPPEMATLLQLQVTQLNREALIAPLVMALQDESPVVRSGSAMVLGQLQIKDGRTLKPLTAALKDPNEDVRFRAGEALTWMGVTNEDLKGL